MPQPAPIKSPCVKICVVDPATGWCEGCFRTMAEIGSWMRYSAAERDQVLRLLPARRKTFAATSRAEAPE
ncbi:DUF1289 domain-containing protein [Chenggangzhangella methanolivorans]|uniref:DUF1289 domain-containing protein n=1 Tax=Chenggangzhangella methanolivorans TaxID=1437009 RepID=A0A9E6R9U2_9HYPH|nr:DUF1289 domain-containing protein [Chenggangzhangella methanolivorans]QZO00192.1 DUF1289 domain-containing protein [Chenggangzhangella methanolivorans]